MLDRLFHPYKERWGQHRWTPQCSCVCALWLNRIHVCMCLCVRSKAESFLVSTWVMKCLFIWTFLCRTGLSVAWTTVPQWATYLYTMYVRSYSLTASISGSSYYIQCHACICKLYASQLYAIFSSLNGEANHLTFVSVKSSPPSPNKSYALVTQYCCMWQLYVR